MKKLTSSANKSTLCVLALMLGVFLSLLANQSRETVIDKSQLSFPHPIGDESTLTVTLPESPYSRFLQIKTTLSGPVGFWVNDTVYTLNKNKTDDTDLQYISERCQQIEDDHLVCSNVVFSDGSRTTLEYRPRLPNFPDRYIKDIEVKTIKSVHNSSLTKDRVFLAVVILVLLIPMTWIMHQSRSASQWILVGAALLFMLANHILFTVSLFVMLGFCYWTRTKIQSAQEGKPGRLILMLVLLVGFLILFKYGHFAVEGIFANPGGFPLYMPLGLSYFIIRLLDTEMRWYRKEQIDVSFREFLCFIIFPGTLIAGPIETIDQFRTKRLNKIAAEDVAYGFTRSCIGLFKKIVLVDLLLKPKLFGELFYNISHDVASVGGYEVIQYTFFAFLYAYLDFSAYSDIAIGLSRVLGYRIRENFHFPIFAENLRIYWKRWHMSLSNWCFNNIYFPMMLNTRNAYFPLYITMMVVGLWHAYNLAWFTWAIHHSTGLVILTLFQKKVKANSKWSNIFYPVRMAATILYVMAGFCFVWFSDYPTCLALYKKWWLAVFQF